MFALSETRCIRSLITPTASKHLVHTTCPQAAYYIHAASGSLYTVKEIHRPCTRPEYWVLLVAVHRFRCWFRSFRYWELHSQSRYVGLVEDKAFRHVSHSLRPLFNLLVTVRSI